MQSRVLTKSGLYRFVSCLEAQSGDFVTVYATHADFPDFVEKLTFQTQYSVNTDEIKLAIKSKTVLNGVRRYETGVAIFWSAACGKYLVVPPFPITESRISIDKLDTSGLRDILERRYVTGVVLVTWGSYAIGVFDAESLVAWKTGTGHIHKGHKKGGRSQKRFARRTEEQKRDFLRRVGNRIDERFDGFVLDHIFLGGNKLIAQPLIQTCRYLQSKASKISPRVLNVRHADREALARSLNEITKSLVFTF